MEETEKNRNKLLLSLLLVFLALASLGIYRIFPSELQEKIKNDYILEDLFSSAVRIVVSVLLIIAVKKIYNKNVGITSENLFKVTFVYGVIIILSIVFQMFTNYQQPEKSLLEALPYLGADTVSNLCVGLFEEVMCRALLFGALLEYFGDTKKGLYLSVFMSSGAFGLFHLLNLLSTPQLVIATITQVIYATFIGVLFAAIYYRSKNLLACALLHGVFDLTDSFWKCFANNPQEQVETANVTDISAGDALILIVLTSTYLISGLWQLRKIYKEKQRAANAALA